MDDSEEAKVTTATNALAAARDAVNRLPESYDGKDALARQLQGLQTSLNGKKMSRVNALVAAARTKINALTNASEEEMITQAAAALAKAKAAMATPSQITPLETSLATKRTARATHLVTLAQTAVDKVEKYNSDAVAAATTALDKAKMAVDQLPAAQRGALPTSVAGLRTDLNTRKAAQMRNLAPALFSAMDGPNPATDNALDNLQSLPYYITGLVDRGNDTPSDGDKKGERTDFRIDPAQGAGLIADNVPHTAVHFSHRPHGQDSMTAEEKVHKYGLSYDDSGEDEAERKANRVWTVTNYKVTTGSGEGQYTDRVLMYNDREGGPLRSFVIPIPATTFFADTDARPLNVSSYDADNKKLIFGTRVDWAIASPEFDRRSGGTGSKTYRSEEFGQDKNTEMKIRGSYHSAPGYYHCTPTDSKTCSVGKGTGGGPLPGYNFAKAADNAQWTFVHDDGAKALAIDYSYFYFGWWVRENEVGKPVAISAFYRAVGGDIDLATDGGSGAGLNGKATYKGPAIGQYAINDPLNDKLEGGTFTATATLNATFGLVTLTPDTGLTGMIKDFRLNGGSADPGWEVTLQKGAWTTGQATDDVAGQKGHIDGEAMTAWSINGTAAAPAGSWVASMYETTGTIPDGGDDSNHPTAILGKFYSEYGGTHRMTGAFATKLLPPEE